MSCYFRDMKDVFEEAGSEVTKDNNFIIRIIAERITDAKSSVPYPFK